MSFLVCHCTIISIATSRVFFPAQICLVSLYVESPILCSTFQTLQLSNLVDEMAADPDDKHMPASVRTAYRCEKDPTGDLNRDSLINHINEIALNTPDKEEKVKFEPGVKRGKVYVPVYNEAQLAQQEKEDEGQVRLDPEMEEALSNATMKDIMELADILNTNPQVTITLPRGLKS